MTRPEAERARVRLSAEHADRYTHSFILSERDGIWSVAKVALPELAEIGPRLAEASTSPGVSGEAAASGSAGSRLAGG